MSRANTSNQSATYRKFIGNFRRMLGACYTPAKIQKLIDFVDEQAHIPGNFNYTKLLWESLCGKAIAQVEDVTEPLSREQILEELSKRNLKIVEESSNSDESDE